MTPVTPPSLESGTGGFWESTWGLALRQYVRNPLAVAGALIIFALLLVSILADVISPYDPYAVSFAEVLVPPSTQHLLGTDHVGRDVFARLLHAGRFSLLIGFSVQAITLAVGLPLGGWSGWIGGWGDFVVMRLVDIMNAFPMLLFQIALISIFSSYIQSGPLRVILVLSLVGWTGPCWLMRSQLLSIREREYVLAARVIGASDWQIIRNHLIPNALSPILVSIAFGVPAIIVTEAGLSFLGLGINPPTPTWGQMIGEASKYIRTATTWYLVIPPIIVLATVLLSFQFVGDGVRDALDPSMRV